MFKSISILFLFITFGLLSFSQQIDPKIYFSETIEYSDNLMQGESYTYKFEFVNQGEEMLKILKIETSCSCIEAAVSCPIVDKNEKGILTVTYKVPIKKGMAREKISIYTNSKKEKVTIKIIGKRKPNRV